MASWHQGRKTQSWFWLQAVALIAFFHPPWWGVVAIVAAAAVGHWLRHCHWWKLRSVSDPESPALRPLTLPE